MHVTTVHPVHDTRIFHKECRSLAAAGYRVALIGPADEDSIEHGVEIIAIPRQKGRLSRMGLGMVQAARACFKSGGELFHFHDPELMPLGMLMWVAGRKVVYDFHENLPGQIKSKHWIPKIFRLPISLLAAVLQRLTGHLAHGVVAATPAIAEPFAFNDVVVVQNFPLRRELEGIAEKSYLDRPNQILYVGGLSRIRGLHEMIETCRHLKPSLGASLCLAGVFDPPALESELANRETASPVPIHYRGWLDRTQVMEEMGRSRVGLLLLHPEPNYLESYPVKLFEYMGCGIPVVASNFPLWSSIISEAGCGVTVDPSDIPAVAKAITQLIENPEMAARMGQNGIESIRSRYTWEAEEAKLIALYNRIFD